MRLSAALLAVSRARRARAGQAHRMSATTPVVNWAAMPVLDVPECAYMENSRAECHDAAVGELKAHPAGYGPWPLCERHLQRLARLLPRQRARLVRW